MKIQQRGEKMEKYLKILHQCPLFNGLDDDQLFKLLHCLGIEVKHYEKKQTILAEGTPANCVGVLLSGSAQITQVDYYGNRSILFRLEPSDVFAETFACAEAGTIPVTVSAGDSCAVLLIDCNRILHTCPKHCDCHQRLIFNLMRGLAQKAILFHQKLEVTSKRTTREKLMTYLTQCSKEADSNTFDIPFDRQELADYLEVERSGLSAEIGKMRREGILLCERNHFVLL